MLLIGLLLDGMTWHPYISAPPQLARTSLLVIRHVVLTSSPWHCLSLRSTVQGLGVHLETLAQKADLTPNAWSFHISLQ